MFFASARSRSNFDFKMAPEIPKCYQIWCPRWPMLAPRCSKMAHVGAKMLQDGVRMAHVGAKMLQDGAKMGHVGAKMRPRSSEMASTCLTAAVLRPRWARMMRQATQMRPKAPKIFPTCIKRFPNIATYKKQECIYKYRHRWRHR